MSIDEAAKDQSSVSNTPPVREKQPRRRKPQSPSRYIIVILYLVHIICFDLSSDVPPIKKTRASRPLFHPPGARYCNYIANNVALH